MRLWLLLALVLVIVWVYRSRFRNNHHHQHNHDHTSADLAARDASRTSCATKAGAGEAMVSCAHCGVFLPASEAVSQAGLQFCGSQHRQLHFTS